MKEELNGTQVKLNRLQHEADAKVLARAANHNGGNRQGGGGGGAVGVAGNNVPTKLEIKAPPVELRSSGEVYSKISLLGVVFSRRDLIVNNFVWYSREWINRNLTLVSLQHQ